MPANVKVFWWLSVAVAAYWAIMTAWHVAFPSAHYLAMLAKLPVELREGTRRVDILVPTFWTSLWIVVTLGSAWLAAFRRRSWARWAYVSVFLVRDFLLLWIVVAFVYLVPTYSALHRRIAWESTWNDTVSTWSNPRNYLIPLLTVIAIAAVFTGNAKDWFKAPKSAA